MKPLKENTPHIARMAPDLAFGTVPQLLLKNDAQVYMPFVGDMVFTITNP